MVYLMFMTLILEGWQSRASEECQENGMTNVMPV